MMLNDKKALFQSKKWRHVFKIECFGVKIGVRSNNLSMFSRVKNNLSEILPIPWNENPDFDVEHWITILKGEINPKELTIYKDAEQVGINNSADIIYDLLVSKIRATVAEYANEFVFLHAGVVSWKGRAIILPGKSHSGKTTLVTELVKRNCLYLSDEFAVIDKNGLIHPFPKKLSVRGIIDEHRQVDIAVEEFGGVPAVKPVPVGFLLVSEYQAKIKKPSIKINSSGKGIMASVANSISVRQNPKFVLEVLGVITNQAIVLETRRGEAEDFAEYFLDYLNKLNHLEKV